MHAHSLDLPKAEAEADASLVVEHKLLLSLLSLRDLGETEGLAFGVRQGSVSNNDDDATVVSSDSEDMRAFFGALRQTVKTCLLHLVHCGRQ